MALGSYVTRRLTIILVTIAQKRPRVMLLFVLPRTLSHFESAGLRMLWGTTLLVWGRRVVVIVGRRCCVCGCCCYGGVRVFGGRCRCLCGGNDVEDEIS